MNSEKREMCPDHGDMHGIEEELDAELLHAVE